jgi:predicted nucleic acid-binding protein
MTFAQLATGATVFLDANGLIYHFTGDANYGAACTALVKRIEHQQLHGFKSTHVLADVAHLVGRQRASRPDCANSAMRSPS